MLIIVIFVINLLDNDPDCAGGLAGSSAVGQGGDGGPPRWKCDHHQKGR